MGDMDREVAEEGHPGRDKDRSSPLSWEEQKLNYNWSHWTAVEYAAKLKQMVIWLII